MDRFGISVIGLNDFKNLETVKTLSQLQQLSFDIYGSENYLKWSSKGFRKDFPTARLIVAPPQFRRAMNDASTHVHTRRIFGNIW